MTAPTDGPQRIGLAVPGSIDRISGGYAYARALLSGPSPFEHVALPDLWPAPCGGAEAAALSTLQAWGGPLLIDGLAFGAFTADLRAAVAGRAVALLHHPLALETGLDDAIARRLLDSEAAALATARGVIVTSADTARTASEMFAVAPSRIATVEPGVARRPRASLSQVEPLNILAVGAAIPRKSFCGLVAAASLLQDLDWMLRIVGPLDADPVETARIRSAIDAAELADRIALVGPLSGSAMDAAYAGAQVFVSSSVYEGYGMAIAEALTAGLPIVAVDGGAVARTAPSAHLCDAEPESIALRLRALLTDPDLRRRSAEASLADAARQPDWPTQRAAAAAAVRRLLERADDV